MSFVKYLTDKDVSRAFPERNKNAHKGDFGYVGIFGGSPEFGGAVKLANLALSALRSGAGVSRLIIPESLFRAVSPYILESTLCLLPDGGSGRLVFSEREVSEATADLSSLAFGMGAGRSEETLKIARYLLNNFRRTLILDADALNVLSTTDKAELKGRKYPTVITPHPKEMSRLCGLPVDEILEKPQEIATVFAREHGVVVLLKGRETVITDGETVYLSNRGSAGMATGGSGDVLAGVIAGICGFTDDPLLAASAGAYICGAAGERAAETVGEYGMLPSDTVSFIAETIKNLEGNP